MIKKKIYKLAAQFRNPNLYNFYNQLKHDEKLSIDDLESIQIEKCKRLLIFANEHSAFWRQVFKKNDFDPYKFSSLQDLKLIPVIEKKDLIENKDAIQSKCKFNKLFVSKTSGSTGQRLVFKKNEEWDSFHRASIMRGYSWYGINVEDKNLHFRGVQDKLISKLKSKLTDYLENKIRIFKCENEQVEKIIKKCKNIKYIQGYSSLIYLYSKQVNRSSLDCKSIFKNIKFVKGTSENIYDGYQNEVMKAFGAKMVSEYGAAESGIIAFECPHGKMHQNMEGVIVECINNEIIVTNLYSHSFPIIRYKLGDYIEIDTEKSKCKCGMNHHVIKSVIGRSGHLVVGFKNSYPNIALYWIFKNLYYDTKVSINYKIEQKEKGRLEINIEQELDQYSIDYIKNAVKKHFNNDVSCDIKLNQNLYTDSNKKKDFVSHLL